MNSLITVIGSQEIQRMVQFRVREGADLLRAIEEAVTREGISAGIFTYGVGALTKGVFRNVKTMPEKYPIRDENRLYFDLEAPLELVSLGGWIASKEDGSPEIHCHFAASTVIEENVTTLGGHLTYGTIAGLKVVIGIAVLNPANVAAVFDNFTKSMDITFRFLGSK